MPEGVLAEVMMLDGPDAWAMLGCCEFRASTDWHSAWTKFLALSKMVCAVWKWTYGLCGRLGESVCKTTYLSCLGPTVATEPHI